MLLDSKLETLLSVVKEGSYTKAAQRLHLTQPAVSHHIQQLEKEFGVRLFQQGKRKPTPTAEGEILIQYARRMTAMYARVQQEVEDCKRQLRHLHMGITQTAGENLMPQVLAQYCEEHPEIRCSIRIDTIKKLYRRLISRELDMAVIEGPPPDQKQELADILLDTDYLCVIVAPNHPLAGAETITIDQLRQQRLILRPAGTGTRSLFESCLQSQRDNIRNYHIMMEIDNVAIIKDLVAKKLGVSVIARSACMQELKEGKLTIVPVNGLTMVREIHMLYHRDFPHLQIAEDLKHLYDRLC